VSFRAVVSVISVAVTVALLSLTAFAGVKEDIANRINPVGDTCMAGDPCAAAVVEVVSGPRSGDEIYQANCTACHNTGAAGAPKLGDIAAWQPRLEQGIDTLYTHAIDGIRAMPAMGLCGSCSEDDIKITVDYMVAESQ